MLLQKQPGGSCVTQIEEKIRDVYSLLKCVSKCLSLKEYCQGVTYDDTNTTCSLSRETTLEPCREVLVSTVTYTMIKDTEPMISTATTIILLPWDRLL